MQKALQDLGEKRMFDLIGLGIELAGDGGISPFTDEEYNEMVNFLNRLREQYNR